MEALLAEVQAAPDEGAARVVTNRMWELWTDAPDEIAQEMLNHGMAQRGSYDFLGAIAVLDRLVAYCPDYPSALVDLDRALELSPNHIAARAGRALTLLGLGRKDEARTDLKQALALNPWLSERSLLADGGPLAPEGEEL